MIREKTFLDDTFRQFDPTLNMTMERLCKSGVETVCLFRKLELPTLGGRLETDP